MPAPMQEGTAEHPRAASGPQAIVTAFVERLPTAALPPSVVQRLEELLRRATPPTEEEFIDALRREEGNGAAPQQD